MTARPYVVVSGPPASGKSTVAPEIASRLQLPLIAKDTIKDALMSVLPVPDVAASQQFGHASVRAMLAVARQSPVGAVVEGNFYRSAGAELASLPGAVVEVFCRCDRHVAAARYAARAGTRHAGHFDHQRTEDELWHEEVTQPVSGGWPVIEIDTQRQVDVGVVVEEIRRQLT